MLAMRANSKMRMAIVWASSLLAVPSEAMEISRVRCDGGDVLKLRGDIVAGDYVKFRSQLRRSTTNYRTRPRFAGRFSARGTSNCSTNSAKAAVHLRV